MSEAGGSIFAYEGETKLLLRWWLPGRLIILQWRLCFVGRKSEWDLILKAIAEAKVPMSNVFGSWCLLQLKKVSQIVDKMIRLYFRCQESQQKLKVVPSNTPGEDCFKETPRKRLTNDMDFPLDFIRTKQNPAAGGMELVKKYEKGAMEGDGCFDLEKQIRIWDDLSNWIPETNKPENSRVFFNSWIQWCFRINKNHQLPLLNNWHVFFFPLASENHLQMEMANLSVWITLRFGRAWFFDIFLGGGIFQGFCICTNWWGKTTTGRRIPVSHLLSLV